jgi:hypothetical protein
MHVEDEKGRPWHVSGGDPGSKAVNLCRRHGYDYVVLPTSVLRHGDMAHGAWPLSEPDGVVARLRLLDCMEVLSA